MQIQCRLAFVNTPGISWDYSHIHAYVDVLGALVYESSEDTGCVVSSSSLRQKRGVTSVSMEGGYLLLEPHDCRLPYGSFRWSHQPHQAAGVPAMTDNYVF